MHRIWHIPELVNLMLDELDGASSLALGLSARQFLEPALDSRWSLLSSLAPLTDAIGITEDEIKTVNIVDVGEDLERLKDEVPFFQKFDDARLDKMRYYSARVRSLLLSETSELDGKRARMFVHLCREGNLAALFPRLQTLHIVLRTLKFGVSTVAFNVPTLKQISFQIMPHAGMTVVNLGQPPSTVPLTPFFPVLAMLRRLDIFNVFEGTVASSDLGELLRQIVDKFPELKEVGMPTSALSGKSLAYFGTLRRLGRLHVWVDSGSQMEAPLSLPSLTCLTLMFRVPQPADAFFSKLEAPLLEDLQLIPLDSRLNVTEADEEYASLIRTLVRTTPSLSNFAVSGLIWIHNTARLIASPFPFDPFRPLLQCRQLTAIHISTTVRFSLTDDDLLQIATARPNLTFLGVNCWSPRTSEHAIPFIGERPRVTMRGLRILAEMLPDLKDVILPVSFDDEDPLAGDEEWVSKSKVSALDVYDSPSCSSPESAAKRLRVLFPKIRIFEFCPLEYTKYVQTQQREILFAKENERRCITMDKVRELLGAAPMSKYDIRESHGPTITAVA